MHTPRPTLTAPLNLAIAQYYGQPAPVLRSQQADAPETRLSHSEAGCPQQGMSCASTTLFDHSPVTRPPESETPLQLHQTILRSLMC